MGIPAYALAQTLCTKTVFKKLGSAVSVSGHWTVDCEHICLPIPTSHSAHRPIADIIERSNTRTTPCLVLISVSPCPTLKLEIFNCHTVQIFG